jgi:hypothetical protein
MSTVDPASGSAPSLRLALAYGVEPRTPSGRLTVKAMEAPPREPSAVGSRARLAGVVAAVVPGRVDFSGDVPAADAPSLPMYRHPADRNAAATSVHAGRMIDVMG